MESAKREPVGALVENEVIPWVDVSICAVRSEQMMDLAAASLAVYFLRHVDQINFEEISKKLQSKKINFSENIEILFV